MSGSEVSRALAHSRLPAPSRVIVPSAADADPGVEARCAVLRQRLGGLPASVKAKVSAPLALQERAAG
jgi:hypothetical protein